MHLTKRSFGLAAGLTLATLFTVAPVARAAYSVLDQRTGDLRTAYTVSIKTYQRTLAPLPSRTTDGHLLIEVRPDGTVLRHYAKSAYGAEVGTYNFISVDGDETWYETDPQGFLVDCAPLFEERGILVEYYDNASDTDASTGLSYNTRLWGCEMNP